MLRITHVEELERLLLLLPELVRQQEQRSAFFAEHAGAWLSQVEQTLAARGLYQAASVAMLRSELLAARHAPLPAGAYAGLPSRSKIRAGVAAQVLQRGAEVVRTIVEENRARFAAATETAQWLASVAVVRGLLSTPTPGLSRTHYLLDLRNRLLQAGSDSAAAVLRMEAMVGPNDGLVLLDRALVLREVAVSDVPTSGAHADDVRAAGVPLIPEQAR